MRRAGRGAPRAHLAFAIRRELRPPTNRGLGDIRGTETSLASAEHLLLPSDQASGVNTSTFGPFVTLDVTRNTNTLRA